MIAAQSVPGGMASLTGRNQLVLDGIVVAVLAPGGLQVDVGLGVLSCGSQVDRVFRAGERVRLMATDQGTYECMGLATLGGSVRTAVLPVPPSLQTSNLSSQSLYEALVAIMVKQNQVLKRGRIVAVLSDRTLQVNIASRRLTGALARSAVNRAWRAGEACYAMQYDNGGSWLVTGLAR